jgi:hypothetical protein
LNLEFFGVGRLSQSFSPLFASEYGWQRANIIVPRAKHLNDLVFDTYQHTHSQLERRLLVYFMTQNN